MEKDHEEYNIGVLDIYGFEIFQVRQCNTQGLSTSDLGGFCYLERGRNPKHQKRKSCGQNKSKKSPTQLPGH